MKPLLGLVMILLLAVPVFAQVQQETKPGDFFIYELAASEAGAFLGGTLGFGVGALMLDALGSDCSGFICFGNIAVLLQSLQVGRALGSVAGVYWMGGELGVRGNIWAALAFTTAWAAMSFDPLFGFFSEFCSITLTLHDPCNGVLTTIWFFPGIPALLATLGFNLNASMEDITVNMLSDWNVELPLLEVQF